MQRIKTSRWPTLIGLVFLLLIAACAANEPAADNDKPGGFYGGVTGGGVRP